VKPAPPQPVLKSLAGRPVFSVGNETYCWEDVVLAARRWGDWPELVGEVREGVACIRRMLTTGRRPSDAEEEAAATQFRTARKLFSAQDTEAWLQERTLSADHWMKYIRRTLLRERWAADLPELVARYPARKDQVYSALKPVGICSGRLMRFAWKLAGRAAVHARLAGEGSADATATTPAPALSDLVGAALLGLPAGECDQRLARIAALDASFRRFGESLVTPAALLGQVAARNTDWIRVEYCSLLLPTAEAADEAALCVREDGEALADVAVRCHMRPVHSKVFLEQLHPSLRARLLSARKGELLGPLPAEGGFKLCALVDKHPATPQDDAVRRRAEEFLIAAGASPLATERVQWRCAW
jgi:hypothetical protein